MRMMTTAVSVGYASRAEMTGPRHTICEWDASPEDWPLWPRGQEGPRTQTMITRGPCGACRIMLQRGNGS